MKKLLMMALLSACMVMPESVIAVERKASEKTFPASELVTVEKVTFRNRFEITVVGDMYLPKNMDKSKRYATIIVGHPFGGVKEQTAGLYAQKMAERGFVTLAFDASHYGESGGEPRYIESPETHVEDFSAAVDFIGTRSFIDRNRIGVIGICGGGGYAVSAAQIDHRMKAIATISMYDMGRERRQGLGDAISYEQRMKTLDEIGEQRWIEFAGGPRRDVEGAPVSVTAQDPEIAHEFYEYYRTKRGGHPNAPTSLSFTSTGPLMNFFPFVQIETISPRPLLFIAGERAASRYFSEDAYELAAEPKELHIVSGASHVDLYDRQEYMPIDKLEAFFNNSMK